MRGASDVRLVLEIACTRLARPESDLTIEALAERVARLEAMAANAAVPASVAAAQASTPAAVAAAPATTQQPTLISGARAATPAATAAPAAAPAHQGGMLWDRGAAVPAAQPAPKSAAPAPAPKPVTPAPQPVAAPAPAPAASTVPVSKPNNAAQVAAAGAAETPAVEDAGELQRKWAEVVERVKARQASYAGPTTAPSSPSRSLRARPLPSRCSAALTRNRWSCRRSARSSVVAPSTTSWMEVARRLLNMRSILHLHGLRYLRTRNPCPRRPLYPRASARRSQKRRR